MDNYLIAAAAQEIADHIRSALSDFDVQSVSLDRQQALLALGILDGLGAHLVGEANKKLGPT